MILRDGHFAGNLAVLLRNAPTLVRDGLKTGFKAFHVLVLVAGQNGESVYTMLM